MSNAETLPTPADADVAVAPAQLTQQQRRIYGRLGTLMDSFVRAASRHPPRAVL
jgi:hypothetical protein